MLCWQKRKKHNTEGNCNETSKTKRHRLSVLRLSGETGREGPSSPAHVCLQEDALGRRVGRSAPSHICLGENVNDNQDFTSILLDDSGEDGREEPTIVHENSKDLHLHNLDNSIVQFTVGANNLTEVLLPIIGSTLEPVDILGSPANTDPAEPSECTLLPSTALVLTIWALTVLFTVVSIVREGLQGEVTTVLCFF